MRKITSGNQISAGVFSEITATINYHWKPMGLFVGPIASGDRKTRKFAIDSIYEMGRRCQLDQLVIQQTLDCSDGLDRASMPDDYIFVPNFHIDLARKALDGFKFDKGKAVAFV